MDDQAAKGEHAHSRREAFASRRRRVTKTQRRRIPRPRHLFPEPAFLWLQSRRLLLRLEWAGREFVETFPTWTAGAVAGTLGIMLAILLFLMRDPAASAAPVSHVPHRLASPSVEESDPEPTPTIITHDSTTNRIVVAPPPSVTAPALSAALTRTSLPPFWDGDRRVTTTVNASPRQIPVWDRLRQQGADNPWRPAVAEPRNAPQFTPYVLRGLNLPQQNVDWSGLEYVPPQWRGQFQRRPTLTVEKRLPPVATVGEAYTYVIHIRNDGADVLDQLRVREQLTVIDRVTHTSPAASVQGNELVWQLGPLLSGEQAVLQVTVLLDQPERVDTETRVDTGIHVASPLQIVTATTPTPRVPVEPSRRDTSPILPDFAPSKPPEPRPVPAMLEPAHHEIPVFEPLEPTPAEPTVVEPTPAPVQPAEPGRPELQLTVAPRESLRAGDLLSIVYTVTNVGTASAQDVVLYVDLSDEFDHRYGQAVRHSIRRLEPGASRRAVLRASVRDAGRGILQATLRCSQGEHERKVTTVDVAPGPTPAKEQGEKSKTSTRGLSGSVKSTRVRTTQVRPSLRTDLRCQCIGTTSTRQGAPALSVDDVAALWAPHDSSVW